MRDQRLSSLRTNLPALRDYLRAKREIAGPISHGDYDVGAQERNSSTENPSRKLTPNLERNH